jgi:hypothetical protein
MTITLACCGKVNIIKREKGERNWLKHSFAGQETYSQRSLPNTPGGEADILPPSVSLVNRAEHAQYTSAP